MKFSDLIEELSLKETEISFSEGKLKYHGRKENITPDIIEKLKQFKGKLIRHFWPKELGNLMPINPIGSKIPLFIVHGDNSNYIISEYLGQDQPVFGFFHPGSDGEKIPFKSAEQMARTYLDRIMMVYPQGPYFLVGYSFGGLLAYEIAVQLQKMGHLVPLLVLIDSESPLSRAPKSWKGNFFKCFRRNILHPANLWLRHASKLAICRYYILTNKPIPIERRNNYIWLKYTAFTRKYSPSKFNGEILFFKSTENPDLHGLMGWGTLADNIKVIDIQGNHLEVFIGESRTEIICTEIEKHLDNANEVAAGNTGINQYLPFS